MAKTGKIVSQMIEDVTMENSEDWTKFVEICDTINNSAEGPREAIRTIQKRLSSKHPTTLRITLALLEACVKNCGMRFHVQMATTDFLEDYLNIIKPKNNPSSETQRIVLGLLQAWAIAFEGFPELREVCRVYEDLKNKGVEFPPPQEYIQRKSISVRRPSAIVSTAGNVGNLNADDVAIDSGKMRAGLEAGGNSRKSIDLAGGINNASLNPTGQRSRKSRDGPANLGLPSYSRIASLSPGGNKARKSNPNEISPNVTSLAAGGLNQRRSSQIVMQPLGPNDRRVSITPRARDPSPTPGSDTRRKSSAQEIQAGLGTSLLAVAYAQAPIRESEIRGEVDKIQQNCRVFVEMLSDQKKLLESRSDQALVEDLNTTCRQMQKRIELLQATTKDEELIDELHGLNDELKIAFVQYDRYRRCLTDKRVPGRNLIDLDAANQVSIQLNDMSIECDDNKNLKGPSLSTVTVPGQDRF